MKTFVVTSAACVKHKCEDPQQFNVEPSESEPLEEWLSAYDLETAKMLKVGESFIDKLGCRWEREA